MEKIKIGQAQKFFVDNMLSEHGIDAFNVYMKDKKISTDVLKGFSIEEISLIFNKWYALDSYEVGDFVKIYGKRAYYLIVQLDNRNITLKALGSMFEDERVFEVDKIRLIKTAKWEQILFKLGRDTPSLKKNDVLITKEGSVMKYIHPLESREMIKLFTSGDYKLFYPYESSVK